MCKHIKYFKDKDVARTLQKVKHIKGRLLDQTVVLFTCALFKMGTSEGVDRGGRGYGGGGCGIGGGGCGIGGGGGGKRG